MNTVKAYEGEWITIRLMTKEDLPFVLEANHNPDIEQLSGGIYPQYESELEEFFENEIKDGSVCFVILLKETGEVIGEVGLHDIRQRDQVAELSITIFQEENHQKGYGSDALNVLMRYAFDYLSLRKIVAWVYSPNIPSITIFEEHGFECVARQKAHRLFRGKFIDFLCYEKFRESPYENMVP